MRKPLKLMLVISTCSVVMFAQTSAASGVTARMVVTMGHFYGQETPLLSKDDLIVTVGYDQVPVTRLIPLRADRAGLELFFVVDRCSTADLGPRFQELRKFILSQASSTAIGVAYIGEGKLEIAQKPTSDHNRAIAALTPPSGEENVSNPFAALSQLIQSWDQVSLRRAVIMISNGIDADAAAYQTDASAEAAIRAAQRAGIIVYAIYHPSADYATTLYSKIHSGQVQLSHLTYETGGEAYFLSRGPLPSLAPFLADLADHLANQYLLEFPVNHAEGAEDLQQVTVKSKTGEIELMVPDRVRILGNDGSH